MQMDSLMIIITIIIMKDIFGFLTLKKLKLLKKLMCARAQLQF